MKEDKKEIRQELFRKLLEENCFWSYDMSRMPSISDDILIAESLIHLDVEDTNKLFKIFGKHKIKKVWLKKVVPLGHYYEGINRFIAWFYFDIKYPDRYLKGLETKYFNKLKRL